MNEIYSKVIVKRVVRLKRSSSRSIRSPVAVRIERRALGLDRKNPSGSATTTGVRCIMRFASALGPLDPTIMARCSTPQPSSRWQIQLRTKHLVLAMTPGKRPFARCHQYWISIKTNRATRIGVVGARGP